MVRLSPPLLKHPLDVVDHIIHQPAAARLGAAEPQAPAVAAGFAADGQALFQVQHPAGSAGLRGGGVGLGAEGLGQGGQQGSPLAGQAFAAVFCQNLVDQGCEAAAQAGGDTLHLGKRQLFGGGEEAIRRLDHHGEGAQTAAFLPGGGGVQGGDGLIHGVEEARIDGGGDGGPPLPRAQVLADFVFGDHLGHGVGQIGGGAQEGGDGGEVAIAAPCGQKAHGGEAAQARDQAVAVGFGGGVQGPNLDRLAQAIGGDRGGEVFKRGIVQGDAVAQKRVVLDFGGGQGEDGVHGGLLWLGNRERQWGEDRVSRARAALPLAPIPDNRGRNP